MASKPTAAASARPRGRPRTQDGLDTRADLLRVAQRLFGAHGYAGTSMSAITAEAGVTVPVIYQRFGSKAGLYVAAAQDVYSRGIHHMRESVAGAQTFHEAMEDLLAGFSDLFKIDPTAGPMVATVLSDVERHEELATALRPALQSLRTFLRELAELAPPELARDARARADLTRALVALATGLMAYSALVTRPSDYDGAVSAMRLLVVPNRCSEGSAQLQ